MADISISNLAQFKESASRAARLLKLIGNEQRLLVLCQLVEKEMSVGELQAGTDLSQSALSQHLARMRDDGIVTTRREKQMIFYSIADEATLQVMQTLAAIFCPSGKEDS